MMMDKSRVITLISVQHISDAIGQQVPHEIFRDVFCNITSVSASEWFDAGKAGLKAEYRATVFSYDYQGEELAELDGVRYGIYRTYVGKNENVELYLERKAGIYAKSQSE